MRALYPVRYFPTLTETFIRDEVEGMAQAGCAVTVASLGRRADGALADPLPGVPVVEVPRRPLLGRVQPSTAAQRQLARWQRPKDAQRLPWLRRLASDFDVLAVHFAGEAAEFAWAIRQDGGPPYVVTVHAVDLFKPRPSIARVLADAGAVLTVEPGLYFARDDRSVQKELRGIGVRIEDDVLISKRGPEVLTAAAPKSVRDIEALMKRAR